MVNYTEREIPYTRVIEHKHFEFGTQPGTVITREYPAEWREGDEPYYPVNDERNSALLRSIRSWRPAGRILYSAGGWDSTAIMIWTR